MTRYTALIVDWDKQQPYAITLATDPRLKAEDVAPRIHAMLDAKHYHTVSLEAEDLEEVFAKLNRGSGCEIDFSTRSLSVGDLVRDEDTGKLYFCATIGWQEVPTP